MESFSFVMMLFIIFVVVMAIILIILRFTRSKTIIEPIVPDLQSVFDQGQTGSAKAIDIDLEMTPKPFEVLSNSRINPILNAFVFTDDLGDDFTLTRYVGFRFRTTVPVNIVSLQYIRQLSLINTTHTVAIYNVTTTAELTSPADRVVNSITDPTNEDGFVTHQLINPIFIPANTICAIIALVDSNDQFLADNSAVVTVPTVIVEGGASTTGASLTFPTVFTPNVQYFTSFQFQRLAQTETSVFEVSVNNGGYPRFPPKYVRGLNVSVPLDGLNVLIDQGCAASQYAEANIVVPIGLALTSKTGVNGLDQGTLQPGVWYYVYVIASSSNNIIAAGLLSLGRVEPQVMPIGYDIFRRVGSVYITSAGKFDPMQQEGDGPSRTSFFLGNVFAHELLFANTFGEQLDYKAVEIPFVPATATQCTISVRGTMRGNGNPDTPVNALVRFRPRFAAEEGVWTLGIPDERSTFGQITITLSAMPLPHQFEYRVFPKEGTTFGFIPSDVPGNYFFQTQYYINGFFETI